MENSYINRNFNILVVDDEKSMVTVIELILKKENYTVFGAYDYNEAINTLNTTNIDIIITDINLPGKNGIEILKYSKSRYPNIDVIIITAYASKETAIEALRLGAYDYIEKGFTKDDLIIIVQRAIQKRSLFLENIYLKEKLASTDDIPEIVGNSPEINHIKEQIKKIASQKISSILITGESGTGKEVTARAIHRLSNPQGQFIPVNCSAIPATLLESILFGHEKGTFTDAHTTKIGIFEQANKGTLLLDEIGDMPYNLQSKILRVIEEKKVRRLGGNQDIPVDFLLISATNQNIQNLIQEGKFRLDLYYRLNVATIDLPPLRKRKEDIIKLIFHFIKKYKARFEKNIKSIDNEALFPLMSYNWPGNIRELENTIEKAIAFEDSDILTVDNIMNIKPYGNTSDQYYGLPTNIQNIQEQFSHNLFNLESYLQQIELSALIQALKLTKGNKKKAANLLSLSTRQMRYKTDKYKEELKDILKED